MTVEEGETQLPVAVEEPQKGDECPAEASAPPEKDVEDEEPERERWDGKWAFILAAIGSAVGLGNFWRFPYLVYKHGGGPFLIPYWLAVFVIGIPMLLLELSMGQRHQAGDVAAFGAIHPKLRGVGAASVWIAWVALCSYMVIIAYCAIYFIEAFWQPWNDVTVPQVGECLEENHGKGAYHFMYDITREMDVNCTRVGRGIGDSEQFAPKVIAANIGCWVIVAFSCLYGVKTASKVVWVTMPLPFILAVILFIFSMTLDGAADGINAYLGTWDFDRLREPDIWTDAVGQVFFSLSVCLGVMTSYGSYRPANRPLVANVFIISMTNCIFSFFVGFIVFATLGNMAWNKNNDCQNACRDMFNGTELEECLASEPCNIEVADVTKSGLTLVFMVFPEAFTAMGDAGYFFGVITFLMLFLLGWDSAFSMLEAITTVLLDAPVGQRKVRHVLNDKVGERFTVPLVTLAVSLSGVLVGLLYCADIGADWLDIVDHFTNNYGMLIDGVLQVIAVGWVAGVPAMKQKVGDSSAMWFCLTWLVASFLLVILTITLAIEMAPCEKNEEGDEVCYTGGELAVGFLAFFIVIIIGWVKSFLASGKTIGEWWNAVFWAGPDDQMEYVNRISQRQGVAMGYGSHISDFFGAFWGYWWMFMVKYVNPIVLSFLVMLTLKSNIREPYGGYPRWMQNICWVFIFGITLFLFVVFLFLPGNFGESLPLPDAQELYEDELRRKNPEEQESAGANEPIKENEPAAEEQV